MVQINQSVAILIDGNNIEKSLHSLVRDNNAMINFDTLISKLLVGRGLSRLIYFREGISISSKLAGRLHENYFGSVVPCYKSADIPLSIKAMQIAQKVDTIVIMSGDADYVELVRHLKSEGVRVEIAAIPQTTAKILLDEADYFFPITEEHCFIYNKNAGRSPQRKFALERKQPMDEKKAVRFNQNNTTEKRENTTPQKAAPAKKNIPHISNTKTTQRPKIARTNMDNRKKQEERTTPPTSAPKSQPMVAKSVQEENSTKDKSRTRQKTAAKRTTRKKTAAKKTTAKRAAAKRTSKTAAPAKNEKKTTTKSKTNPPRKKVADRTPKAEKKTTTRRNSRGGRKKKVED